MPKDLLHIQGKLGNFGFPGGGERASVKLTFSAKERDHDNIDRNLAHRELTGRLYEGDDEPDQMTIDQVEDRYYISGPFQTGKVGYNGKDQTFDLSINFAKRDYSADRLLQLSNSEAYLVVQAAHDIPEKQKDKPDPDQAELDIVEEPPKKVGNPAQAVSPRSGDKPKKKKAAAKQQKKTGDKAATKKAPAKKKKKVSPAAKLKEMTEKSSEEPKAPHWSMEGIEVLQMHAAREKVLRDKCEVTSIMELIDLVEGNHPKWPTIYEAPGHTETAAQVVINRLQDHLEEQKTGHELKPAAATQEA